MAEIKPKLRVDVNHNPTKKGIKVQFVLPQTLEGDAKAQATQKLQSKLNQGLEQYNLTVSQDTDVPYSNVIGFLIPIADIKLLIKNAIGGGQAAPEEAPAPEEPVKENRNQQMLDDKMLSFFSPVDPTELPDNLKNINTPVVEDEKAYFTLDGDSLKIYYKRGGESSFDLTNNILKTSPHLKAALKSLQKGSMKEIKRMMELAGVKEAFDPFLDTELGGYMREYIDQVAEEEGLDLSYRDDFDQAFDMAFVLLNNEHPELRSNIKSILAHRESFF